MANEIEICNIALSRVGANKIQALTEATREARACNTHYEIARDDTLSEIDWGFARQQKVLAELSETRDGWDYVYAYPAGCLVAREIYNSAKVNDEDKIKFDVGLSSDGNQKVVLTDEEDAQLIYTAQVTNASVFPIKFVNALSWRLAAELAVPLRGVTSIFNGFYQMFLASIGKAAQVSANEHHKVPSESSSFTNART